MPGPLSGRRSRTTRCAARSVVRHPAHNVGASGPYSTRRSQRVPRSCCARPGDVIETFRERSQPLSSACALAVRAPRPATGSTLTFLELLLCSTYTAFSGHLLLGILDPADELVAGERCDVLPCIEGGGVGDQRQAQVPWKPVHHPTGHSLAAHTATVAGPPTRTTPDSVVLETAWALDGRGGARSLRQVRDSARRHGALVDVVDCGRDVPAVAGPAGRDPLH